MKRTTLTAIFSIFLVVNLFSQTTTKYELINYFDNAKNLDPIEGLWSLNVISTLYFNDKIVGQQTSEVRSEWGVKRYDNLSFKIIDIGEGPSNERGRAEAYFESSAIDGFYTYKCNYTNPNWSIKTNATLEDDFIIEYEYFVSQTYLDSSKNKYKPGHKLHWKFIWTKKYPKLNQSNKMPSNESEWAGNGTGFFISKDGYIATNFHVISDVSEIEIEFIRNGQKQNYKAKVIQSDKQNDLAILKIDDNSFLPFTSIPYNFQTNLTDVGSNVFALGYPMALSVMGTEIKFTDGKISSKTGFQGDISTYQMTTPIQPGNSGGPLFDFDGNLIGINSSKISADVADNVSYAIKSSYLKNLIDVLPTTLSLPNDKTIISKTLTEKIKILSDYVVLIRIK